MIVRLLVYRGRAPHETSGPFWPVGVCLGEWRSGDPFDVSPPAGVGAAEARDPILYFTFSGTGPPCNFFPTGR